VIVLNLNDRIRQIRKDSSFKNQSDFANFLGTTRPAIASYELGKVIPNNTFLQLLCSKFNVSIDWLKFGKGEMYVQTDDSIFEDFAQKYSLSPAERDVARYCLQLTSTQRAEILNHVLNIAEIIKPTSIKQESINQELADYKQELEAEQRARLVCEDSDVKKNGTK
jgi:transcriptional regulator with XRE-family HTH domain